MQNPTHTTTHHPTTTTHARHKLTKTAVAVAVVAAVIAVPTTAYADHGITTTGDVNLRGGPGTQYPILDAVPSGTSPTYLCWERGENVNGVSVWFKVDYTQEGYISSYLDDSSYDSAEDITTTYGISPCTDTAAAPATEAVPAPAADAPLGNDAPYSCTGPDQHEGTYSGWAACAWAVHNALSAPRFPTNDCTWFVSQALWEGGLAQTGTWTGASYDANALATKNPTSDGFGYPGPTSTATKANTLVEYLVDNGLATRTLIDWSDNTAGGAQIGDLIAYHWNPVGPGHDPDTKFVDHLAIVTGFEDAYPLVSQHTAEQLNRGWSWSAIGNDWIENAVAEDDPSIVPQAWLIHID